MIKNLLKTTSTHSKYWRERKIDWKTSYLDTHNHPHRRIILGILASFGWMSLFEVGCGSGPNLHAIATHLKGKQLGGNDINPDAVKLALETFNGGVFKVGTAQNIMMSDNSVDVVLTDMCLIYIDPFTIDETIEEMKRVTRKYLVLCELCSFGWWEQLKFWWETGYHAHNYQELLEKHGFYDIIKYKLKPEDWPGGGKQEKCGYIYVAKITNIKN